MWQDLGIGQFGLTGGLAFAGLLMGLAVTPVCAEQKKGYTTRAYYGAKFEPKDTVLHGGGQDPVGFRKYRETLGDGRGPVLYMTYTSVTREIHHVNAWGDRLKAELDAEPGEVIPQIGLNLTGGNDTGEGMDSLIARGEQDEQIDAFCKILKEIDRPVFVRIGYEFEGSWNGYQPEPFKAAWVRITEAMKRHDIDFATVWCSAGLSAGEMPLEHRMAYYPGDEWVDWWAIDIFDAYESLHPQTIEFCQKAGEHKKPVMIGEATARHTGVLDGQKDWDEWFVPFFQLIRQQPEIKSFCYINWEWVEWSDKLGFGWHDWGDCRIEMNEVVTEHYRKEMELPLYQHLRLPDKETTTP